MNHRRLKVQHLRQQNDGFRLRSSSNQIYSPIDCPKDAHPSRTCMKTTYTNNRTRSTGALITSNETNQPKWKSQDAPLVLSRHFDLKLVDCPTFRWWTFTSLSQFVVVPISLSLLKLHLWFEITQTWSWDSPNLFIDALTSFVTFIR